MASSYRRNAPGSSASRRPALRYACSWAKKKGIQLRSNWSSTVRSWMLWTYRLASTVASLAERTTRSSCSSTPDVSRCSYRSMRFENSAYARGCLERKLTIGFRTR